MFTTVLGCAAFAVAFPVTVKATSSAILNSVKKDQEQNAKLCRMARQLQEPSSRCVPRLRALISDSRIRKGFWFFDSEKFPGEKIGTRIPQGL